MGIYGNFHVSNFRSEESDSTLDSRVASYKNKNIQWESDWKNVARVSDKT